MIFWKNEKFRLKHIYSYSKRGIKHLCSDDIITFDIEVTQMFKPYNDWITYDYSIPERDYNSKPCLAFPYIWQLGINNKVYYGRSWNDVKEVFSQLNNMGVEIICYVHNLSYEFCFLRNLFNVEKVFARKAHSIMYCFFSELENIEFRCSYYLTRLSLDDWGKKITKETGEAVEKKVGQLDYNQFRTENTLLTDEELEYCEYDIIVMYKGLLLYRDKYKHLKDIPLTQTGEIRREVKTASAKCGFNKKALSLQPQSYDDYLKLLAVTRGGDSHANFIYCDKVHSNIMCLDYTSSYPFSMCCKPKPMTKFKKSIYIKDKNKAYILKVILKNVEPKTTLHYIPASKCINLSKNNSKDNGRIIYADYLELWVTDLDLDIIKRIYKCDIEILECYSSLLGYMPKDIVELIFKKFAYKTSYKDLSGYESIYLYSKQFINSIYGMSITRLVQDTVLFNDGTGEYDFELRDRNKNDELLNKQLEYASKNPLHYSFGLWTVTQSRKMLWDGFDVLGHDNVYYYDTDSYKGYFSMEDVGIINKKNLKLIIDTQKRYNFKDELIFPKTQKGNIEIMGQLSLEKPYKEFKVLGAKKYAYKYAGENNYHITVAGLSKKAGEYLNSLDDFTSDWYLSPKQSGKFSAKYIEHQPTPVIRGYKVPVEKSVVLIPVGFTNNVADDFINLISNI